jgi:uncharacterized membrane protein YesL
VKKNNNKRLRLFDITRDGKGLSKNTTDKVGGMKRFFISYKDNFGKITSINIFMVIGNFPLIFLIATLSGFTKAQGIIPSFDVFQNLAGYFANTTPSAHSMSLFAHEGLQTVIYRPTVTTYVFYAIAALTLFTFGMVNVGSAYILRNIAKGEPVFLWSDFWYAIKRNWKQALPFGMIDAGINLLLIWNIYSMFINSTGNYFTNTMFWCNIVLFVLYFVMRYYIYVQMVTFNLSVFKILKNSLIFSLLGFKRNLVAFLGILVGILIELICVIGAGGILLPFGIALPFIILFSTFAYMKVYAAYFKIKEVMIDPYLAEHPEEAPEVYDDEIIMSDDVTERERLEEIKRRNSI